MFDHLIVQAIRRDIEASDEGLFRRAMLGVGHVTLSGPEVPKGNLGEVVRSGRRSWQCVAARRHWLDEIEGRVASVVVDGDHIPLQAGAGERWLPEVEAIEALAKAKSLDSLAAEKQFFVNLGVHATEEEKGNDADRLWAALNWVACWLNDDEYAAVVEEINSLLAKRDRESRLRAQTLGTVPQDLDIETDKGWEWK